MSLLIGFLPGVGSPARSPGLSLLYSTLLSLCFALPRSSSFFRSLRLSLFFARSLYPFVSIFLPSLALNPSLPPLPPAALPRPTPSFPRVALSPPPPHPRPSLLPFDYYLRILRTSRLPQVLYLLRLATLVSARRTHAHTCAKHARERVHTRTHTHLLSRFTHRQARCDSRNGRPSLPLPGPPLRGGSSCMCSAAGVYQRNSPTVGIVYRGIQRALTLERARY